jgi:hypothetical protein
MDEVGGWGGARQEVAEEAIEEMEYGDSRGILLREKGELVALAATMEGDGETLLVALATKRPGYGRAAMAAVVEELPQGDNLWLLSLDEARGFYDKIGMKNTRGNNYVWSAKDATAFLRGEKALIDDEPESGAFAWDPRRHSPEEKGGPGSGHHGHGGRPGQRGGSSAGSAGAAGAAGGAFRAIETEEEARAWADKTFGAWADGLTEDQRDRLEEYSSETYEVVNDQLRGYSDYGEAVDLLAADISASLTELPEGVVVYRKMLHASEGEFANKVGDTFFEEGFSSTALTREGAELALYKEPGLIMKIEVPKGVRAGYLGNIGSRGAISVIAEETELLMDSGLQYEVMSSTVLRVRPLR